MLTKPLVLLPGAEQSLQPAHRKPCPFRDSRLRSETLGKLQSIRDLASTSRPRGREALSQKSALQRELIEVNQIIQEMIALLRIEAGRYSISIRSDLTKGPRRAKL